jgi:UDP-glucose 4-epimerase
VKILVTGGAGFIGSHITDLLVGAKHKVTVIDNLSSGRRSNVNNKAKFIRCDIRNAKKLAGIFTAGRFDIVCHHAAQIDVRKSVLDPSFDAEVNVLGTLNLLENAARIKVKKFIFASSGGTIYGECGRIPPDENAPGRPLSPYGITKYTVEHYLHYYRAIRGLNFTILRYANVYGPRQDPHGEAGVVAIFSGKMLNNENSLIFGDGRQTRDYVYVGDVARANLFALRRGNNEVINIGTRKTTSVRELFRRMAFISGYSKKPVFKPARPGELFRSVLEIKKAKKILGWAPSVRLNDGLARTIEFFR